MVISSEFRAVQAVPDSIETTIIGKRHPSLAILRVVLDTYNCSGNYGELYKVIKFIIDYERSTPHLPAFKFKNVYFILI